MKKFKLRPFNKNVLKAVAVSAAVATIGGHIIADHVKKVKHNQAVNTFKEELVDYKTKNDVYEMDKTTETADMETIDIYNKIPRIAIIYHDNGKISLMINREYLSIEAAMEKYPHMTADIRKYIAATESEIKEIRNHQPTDLSAIITTENSLEK